MKFFDLLREWFKKTFQIKRQKKNVVQESPKEIQPEIETREIIPSITAKKVEQQDEVIISKDETSKPAEVKENTDPLPLPKEIFQGWAIDLNTYKPFLPNWGELDPTISTISDGRIQKELIVYLYDEFVKRYGNLTTDLGYGLIYSIVMNAIEKEDRSVSSALREAIARSSDPLLCVAVVKDYCLRNSIHYDKYERITLDILKRRESIYPQSKSGIITSVKLSVI